MLHPDPPIHQNKDLKEEERYCLTLGSRECSGQITFRRLQ
jgi:hypothetical protein